MPPTLSTLYRYPVKSLRGESLAASPVGPQGLWLDRTWMVADANGRLVTGRDYPELVRVTATPAEGGVWLRATGQPALWVANTSFTTPHSATVWSSTFAAWHGCDEADAWLSRYLGARVRLLWAGEHATRRVKSDPTVPVAFADGYPLLLIGQASLDDLCVRVGRPLAMERFRPNLVVSGAAAYAEDGWTRIRIGGLPFRVVKACERCVFTTVDPETGSKSLDQEPLRTLATYRRAPEGVLFGQNVICEGAGRLEVGMAVEVLE